MQRILIVEDEEAIANLIQINLTAQGYHCTCAYDGIAGAGLIEKGIFDLILLDIMNQMVSVEVNHLFANFMPLRLAGSNDFYVQNEIYRFAGMTFDSIIWCPMVTLVLSSGMLGTAGWLLCWKSGARSGAYRRQ